MKIAIITAHFLRNYGSVLQAYALKITLENMGHEVSIIDYLPDSFLKIRKTVSRVNRIIRVFREGFVFGVKRIMRTYSFKRFRKEYFNLTERILGYEQLQNSDLEFDAYFCGSDQIWNPGLYGGLNDGFFLGFVKKGLKIAYAPSIRIVSLDDKMKIDFKTKLHNFDAISVRETTSVGLLQPLSDKKVNLVVDPTLLLTRKQWENLILNSKNKYSKYGVVYETHQNSELEDCIRRFNQDLRLPFYNISNNIDSIPHASNKLAHIGPEGFITTIKEAKFVVTNSFHCIVFCLHFRVPFVAFMHKNDDRFSSLLKPLGLAQRIVNISSDVTQEMLELKDWDNDSISKSIHQQRGNSLKYIKKSLGE